MSGYRRATTLLGVASAVALAALVASCSPSKDAAEMNCPTMLPAPGADTIAVFHPGGQAPKDLLFAAQITSLNAECSRETPGVAIHAEIKFYAERANLLIPDGTLPYFVAVLDADQHVLAEAPDLYTLQAKVRRLDILNQRHRQAAKQHGRVEQAHAVHQSLT